MIDNKILKHKYILLFLVIVFFAFFGKIDVHAEESTLNPIHITAYYYRPDYSMPYGEAIHENYSSENIVLLARNLDEGVFQFVTDNPRGFYLYFKDENITTIKRYDSNMAYHDEYLQEKCYNAYFYETVISNPEMNEGFIYSNWRPLETNLPIFKDIESCKAYFETGDTSGQINKPDLNLDDNEFLKSDLGLHEFIGSNYVNAMWSNEVTAILGMYDIFVDVSVGYSNIKSPDLILRIDNIDSDIPLSDYMWTKKLSSIPVPDKDMFIRYIRFTPYYYKSDPGYYEHGKSSYIYLTRNGDLDYVYSETTEDSNNASHGGGGLNGGNHSIIDKDLSDYDTYSEHLTLPDFKLSDVSYSIVGSYLNIKWIDVTEPGEILFVPDNMTQVACFGYEYDINLKPSIFDFIPDKRVTIGDHKISINLDKMFKKYEENDLEWDFKIHLTPIFAREDRDGKLRLYSGGEIIVDVVKGEINDVYYDENGNEIINQIGTESKLGDMIGDIISPSEDSENPGFVLTFDNLMSLFSGFPQLITSLINFVGSIPGLLASVFSFLPSSIASCVSLLCIVSIFVGLLKILR